MDDSKIFKTDSLALAPYLDSNGIEYLGKEVIEDERTGQYKVLFIFNDDKGVCHDLQASFFRSREKRYKDLLNYYRAEISSALNLGYKRR